MSEYTPSNFAIKDTLATTDPARLIKGAEIQNEFDAIKTSVDSKVDTGFVPTPDPADVPVYVAANLSITGGAASINVGEFQNDNAFAISFTPKRKTSRLLVKYNIGLDTLLSETTGNPEYNLFFQCRLRNLETLTEFDFGDDLLFSNEERISNESDLSSISEEIFYTMLFTDPDGITTIAGDSDSGYEIRLEISQQGGTFTQGIDSNGIVTVQEIFV